MAKPHWDPNNIVGQANHLCTEFRKSMGSLLMLGENDLHCCLKMLTPPQLPATVPNVITWARSSPFDDREVRKPHPMSKETSSVYAALTGGYDGITQWRKFPCFSASSLRNSFDKFKCSRQDWSTYYQSVMVFPIRYVRNPDTNDYDTIGYIAFDSIKKDAFSGLPNIFQYCDNPTEYQNRLLECSAFHLGAIFADSLSAFLHGIYNSASLTGNDNEQQITDKTTEQPTLESPDSPEHGRRRRNASSVPRSQPGAG